MEVLKMARASVKLMKGSSFAGAGHHFGKGETKIVSGPADIAYFKGNQRFRVTMMADAAPAQATAKPSKPSAPAGDGGSGEGEGGDGPLPWNKTMKKADLQEAAESRDIAFTPDDTIANIIQLLTEWDETSGGE